MTKNKRILITGGTGSFGQRITRTIMKNYEANNLVIFSRDELKQFNMMEELGSDNLVTISPIIIGTSSIIPSTTVRPITPKNIFFLCSGNKESRELFVFIADK